MSNYDFLMKYLSNICYIHSPVNYDNGYFSVLVEDAEGYSGAENILFNSEGDVVDD